MKRIFKYPLPLVVKGGVAQWNSNIEAEIPAGAQILSVAIQFGAPVMWAKVDPEAEKKTRSLFILATGAEVPDGVRFIGTLIFEDGGLVFHIFEKV